jgi:hypothetical protein
VVYKYLKECDARPKHSCTTIIVHEIGSFLPDFHGHRGSHAMQPLLHMISLHYLRDARLSSK